MPELAAALDKTTAAMGHAAQSRVNENFLWQNSAELALTLLPKKEKPMDNDNPLLQKAADLYRGLRFTMKYRGVDILPAAAGNDLARDLLESGQPFLFGRCGATEMRTVADWLQNGGHNFTDRTRADIRNLSGVFPTDDATLDKFCRLYVKTAQSAELLALWNVGAEREVIRGCDATRFTELRALEPYYHARPWAPPSRANGCSSCIRSAARS